MLGDDQKRVLDAPWNGVLNGCEPCVIGDRFSTIKFLHSAKKTKTWGDDSSFQTLLFILFMIYILSIFGMFHNSSLS